MRSVSWGDSTLRHDGRQGSTGNCGNTGNLLGGHVVTSPMYDAVSIGRVKRVSVFLSYRRADSAGHAGRLCEHLEGVFGRDRVFMDVEDIAPGQDFADKIEATISACQAVVVVIGPEW